MQKYSLNNTEFIITFRAATADRTENLFTVLRHLKANYIDYSVRLMEADTTQQLQAAQLHGLNVEHHFVYYRGAFPKAYLCNLGVLLASSSVICIHDADSIAHPFSVHSAVVTLTRPAVNEPAAPGRCDVICPYLSVVNINGSIKKAFEQHLDYEQCGKLTLPMADANIMYEAAAGGVVFFRREQYIAVGGYHSGIVGWGGEDDEMLNRSSRLGLSWVIWVPNLIHLHHDSADRSVMLSRVNDTVNHNQAHYSSQCSDKELAEFVVLQRKFFDDFTSYLERRAVMKAQS
jgi:N-terminal domain of galactosyltransferase